MQITSVNLALACCAMAALATTSVAAETFNCEMTKTCETGFPCAPPAAEFRITLTINGTAAFVDTNLDYDFDLVAVPGKSTNARSYSGIGDQGGAVLLVTLGASGTLQIASLSLTDTGMLPGILLGTCMRLES